VTREISIGKYRALQRASNEQSVFTVLAIDHTDSLRRVLNPDAPNDITDEEMVTIKQQVVAGLWNDISGVLLDPIYGAAQMIAYGLPASVGLLVELERADYNMNPLPMAVEIRNDWSVNKIKGMGSDGVKLFYYYDPDDDELSKQQDSTIARTVDACDQYDIPLYAEPIVLNANAENRRRKVIESAFLADQLYVDILKLEFPLDVKASPEIEDWIAPCEELSSKVIAPWVLLSAGVDFETFAKQVEVACQAGASGFIAGRAVWGDACQITDESERSDWLQITGRKRLQQLTNIANEYATPWTDIYSPTNVSTNWYSLYSEMK